MNFRPDDPGSIGSAPVPGLGPGEEIRIEGCGSSVLLDGELFEAGAGRPIVLRPTQPVPFLKLAV